MLFILQIIGELCFTVDINKLFGSSERLDILPTFCFSLTVVHSQEKKLDRKIDIEVNRLIERQPSPFSLGASPCKACSPPFMSISSSSVHFFECSLSCRLELLDWMSFLSPFVDWSALASSKRLRVTSQSAGHQDGAWAQRSGQCYSFFAFWSLRRPAVWFFVAEGLFLLFWWIRVLFPPLPIENCDFWSL